MIYKNILPNGVCLITEEVPYVHSVSIGIWVKTGSRYEDNHILGVSHFLEHMLFKGTENRTSKQIAESLEAVGGQLNAFTAKEYTCYYARVLSENFDLASEVLSDMFLHSLFLPQEMEKERNVILEEIKMYEDSPDELVHDIYARTIFKNNSLGQPIIGTVDTVTNLTRDQLIDYYQKTYVPENVIVVVAGKIKSNEVENKFTKLFSNFSGKAENIELKEPRAHSDIAFITREIEQIHLCLGFPGLPNSHKKIYSLLLLNSALGGGVSSRLFQEVREDHGLTYSIYSYHTGYIDSGIMGVYAGTSMQNVKTVVEIILKQIRDIKKKGLTKEELQRTKQQVKGNLLLSMENISSRMHRIGRSELNLGRIVSPEEVLDLIMQVDNNSIKDVAEQVFKGENLCLAIVGQKNPDLDLESLIRIIDT
ncbi:MAG: M16 family metallopeptidase [Bacillota bacterium]|jgi:predicted Zn-dependent peptidase